MRFDELDRRQHLAMPRRLKKPDVRDVGVDDVQLVEVDALAAQPPRGAARRRPDSRRPRPGRSSGGRNRCPRCGSRLAFMIRFGGSPYAEPDAADRRHRGADHHRVADGGRRRGRQHHDDDQRADRQADHATRRRGCPEATATTAVTDDHGRQDRAAVPPQQDEGDALEQPGLRDHRRRRTSARG